MESSIVILIFIFGAIIGSFLNVCIYRIPRDESISYPPSHCTECGTRIKPYDMIPILSYIFLKGRCRKCSSKISMMYPAVELANGILYALIYMKYGLSISFVKFIIFTSFMIVIGLIDYKTMEVHFKISFFAVLIAVFFIIVNAYSSKSFFSALTYIYGAVLGGGIISLIILLTAGMGWGDAEICLLAGLFLGLQNTILTLFLSFITGGIVGILLIIFKVKSRKDAIPFGPFIVLSSIISMLCGENIVYWYMSLLV